MLLMVLKRLSVSAGLMFAVLAKVPSLSLELRPQLVEVVVDKDSKLSDRVLL